MYVAAGIASIGGLLFSYDTEVISSAILFITKQFSLSATMEEIVVNSVLAGAVLGAMSGGVLNNRFGRRNLIILSGIIFTVSGMGTAMAPTVSSLIAGRVVSGIAIGMVSFITPMRRTDLAIPWCTYCDPEIAHVGLQVWEAREQSIPIKTLTVMMQDVDTAPIRSSMGDAVSSRGDISDLDSRAAANVANVKNSARGLRRDDGE